MLTKKEIERFLMTDTKPTIDEQIEYTQSIVATSMLPTHMPKSILASLERLKKIDSVQVPDEPEVFWIPIEDGTHPMVDLQDYRTLRDLLKQCKRNSGVTMDELGEMRDRAEAAEAKLAAIELELARLNGEIPYGN